MDVEWPDRRADVLAALELLANEAPAFDEAGGDPRWPDLTNAVHWLVDDTWWDYHDPAGSVGTILRDQREADAVAQVVALVVRVGELHGASAPDAEWFADPSWSHVQARAAVALQLLGGPG